MTTTAKRSKASKKPRPSAGERAPTRHERATAALRTTKCPTCKAPAGTRCTPDGSPMAAGGDLHLKRWRAFERAEESRAAGALDLPLDGTAAPAPSSPKSTAPADPTLSVECPKCGAAPGGPCEGRKGVPLARSHEDREFRVLGLDRPCPECCMGAYTPCVDETGHLLVGKGKRVTHAARRTPELPISDRDIKPPNTPKRWPDFGLPKGVVVPSLDDLQRARSGRLPHPWVRCEPRAVADVRGVPKDPSPPRPPFGGLSPQRILGYAYEAVSGATLSVCTSGGNPTWGIAAEDISLESAEWFTSRATIEAELRRFGYTEDGIAHELERSGWGTPAARAKKKPTKRTASKGAKGKVLDLSKCLECEHADCPIDPDCSACPSCAGERSAQGTDTKVRDAEERLGIAEQQAVPFARLRRDGGTQPRAAIDPVTVAEYAEAYRSGAALPPGVAFFDGVDYWLADGFHRAGALEELGREAMPCYVHQGTRRDAVLHAVGANAHHGLRRTQADKRRAVETLLRDEEWARKSDRWIADRCGVSPTTVGTIRAEHQVSSLDTSGEREPATREGRDGKSYPVREREPSSPPAGATDAEPIERCAECDAVITSDVDGCPECGTRGNDEPEDLCAVCHGAGKPEGCPSCEQVLEAPAGDRCPKCDVALVDEVLAACPGCGLEHIWWHVGLAAQGLDGCPTCDGDGVTNLGTSSQAECVTCDGSGAVPKRASNESPKQEEAPATRRTSTGDASASSGKRTWRDVLELAPGSGPLAAIEAHTRLMERAGEITDEMLRAMRHTELDRARALALSQWNTRPELAAKMVELSGIAAMDRPSILEPSAGTGILIEAVRNVCGRNAHVTAHEIDPVLATALRARSKFADTVIEGDFLASPIPSRRYDIGLGNTPYEDGADGRFIERLMDSCWRIVLVLRLNAITGQDRYERVWSRVEETEEWHLADQRVLKKRPPFEGPGTDSAKSDYVVLRLVHASLSTSSLTRVNWW